MRGAPPALPTRKTLVFPAVELQRPRSLVQAPASGSMPEAERFAELLPRESERPTQPTLRALTDVEGSSRTDVIDLSAASLVSDESGDLARIAPPAAAAAAAAAAVRVPVRLPRWAVVGLVAQGVFVHAALAGVIAAVLLGGGSAAARPPRAAVTSRAPLVMVRDDRLDQAPSVSCGPTGPSRVLSARAQMSIGVDVVAAAEGFALGYSDAPLAASGLIVAGSTLRVTDRVRVHVPAGIRHVSVEPSEDEDEPLGVRVDSDDARTVGAPGFKVVASNGWLTAGDAAHPHALWPVPAGVSKLGAKAQGVTTRPVPDALRAVARDDGGAVVAVKKGATLSIGFVDGQLEPVAPLVSLVRTGSMGTPSVVAWGGGAAVAWAERAAGERDYEVMLAALAPDGEAAPQVRSLGKGMSPSVTTLRNGGLLVAYAVGSSGAHQVVVQKLDRTLVPVDGPIAISPDSMNAGQPVAAVGHDGRGLVAFFTADRRGTSLRATPVACGK